MADLSNGLIGVTLWRGLIAKRPRGAHFIVEPVAKVGVHIRAARLMAHVS